jgi:UDP-glucose 4-epimerase
MTGKRPGPADPPPWRGRRVLVTGGLGFIGATLARRLADEGARVAAVDSLLPECGGSLFNVEGYEHSIQVKIADVGDAGEVRQLVEECDVIFNLAGQTSHIDSMQDPLKDLAANCAAQLNLLEICRKHNPRAPIVMTSTRQVYGRPLQLPVDETHPLNPIDVNGINKIAGESYHRLYSRVYGMRTVILRLTNTYGPRMRVKDSRQTFLGAWVRAAVEGRPFEVWGGEQLRDFTYVDDAVDALIAAAALAESAVYNVGGDRVLSLRDAAEMLAEASGTPYVVRDFPADRKRIDIGSYAASDAAFRSASGWAPRVSLEEGIRRSVAFYRAHLRRYLGDASR